jgi:hypothetical protein
MEEHPIRSKFAKTIVALRLALEEIERERNKKLFNVQQRVSTK